MATRPDTSGPRNAGRLAGADRITRWDERYASGEETYGFVPAPLVVETVAGLAPGLGLDLACGAGRHALYLAERGWEVVAVDASSAGLCLLRTEADRRGLATRIETHTADLEAEPPGFEIAEGRWDLICDFFFLHRPLLEAARRGVRPGGLLVAAIHLDDPEVAGNRAFRLGPGELRGLAEGWGWDVLHAAEGPSREAGHRLPTAELVARRPEST